MGPAGPGKTSLALTYHAGRGGAGRDGGLLQLRGRPGHAASRAPGGWGGTSRAPSTAGRIVIQLVNPAELSPGEFADDVRRAVEEKKASRRRHRQPERLPERDARGAAPLAPPPRAARLPEPARRGHGDGRRPARLPGLGHAVAGGPELPLRHRARPALLRGRGRAAGRGLGAEEAERRPRADHPRDDDDVEGASTSARRCAISTACSRAPRSEEPAREPGRG